MKNIYIVLILAFVSMTVSVPAQDNSCEKEKNILLGGIGAMGAADVYLAYSAISVINDNLSQKENYSLFSANIEIVQNLLNVINNYIDEINNNANIQVGDSDFLKKMKELNISLFEATDLLKKFLLSEAPSDKKIFQDKHSSVKKEIEVLFQEEK